MMLVKSIPDFISKIRYKNKCSEFDHYIVATDYEG
jgi:hypothetical protein